MPDPEADTRGVEAISDEERRAGVKLGLLLGHAMTVHSGVPSPGPNTLRMAREVLAAAGVPETHQELDTIRRAWLDSRAEVQRLRAALEREPDLIAAKAELRHYLALLQGEHPADVYTGEGYDVWLASVVKAVLAAAALDREGEDG